MQKAGYEFVQQPLAYQYHSKGALKSAGFSLISNSAMSQPKKGDVVVYGKMAGHSAGHLQMYDGKNWISDFKQKTSMPWSGAKKGGMYYYRDMKSQ